MPEGWVASSCAVDAPCCMDGSPFDTDTRQRLQGTLGHFLHQWGSEPRDRETARVLTVELGALEPAPRSIECTGALTEPHPCRVDALAPFVATSTEDVLVVITPTHGTGILSWRLVLEVTRDADGSLHASACRVQTTDHDLGLCPIAARSPDCATAGTVTLETFSETELGLSDLALQLQVTFADGSTLDLRL